MIKYMSSNYKVLRLITRRREGSKEEREEREKEKETKLISSIFVFGSVTSCVYRQIRLKNVESEMEVNK